MRLRKLADNRTVWFAAVVQQRIKDQTRVFDWVKDHPEQFKVIWILHDKDKKPAEEMTEEVDEKEDSDNEEAREDKQHFYSDSGIVLPHYHLLLRVNSRITSAGLTHQFAHYVQFRRCSNPANLFQYLVHRSFKCSFDEYKHKYDMKDLQTNDSGFLQTFLDGSDRQKIDVVRRVMELLARTGNIRTALRSAIDEDEWAVVAEIKKNSYFYSKFFGD